MRLDCSHTEVCSRPPTAFPHGPSSAAAHGERFCLGSEVRKIGEDFPSTGNVVRASTSVRNPVLLCLAGVSVTGLALCIALGGQSAHLGILLGSLAPVAAILALCSKQLGAKHSQACGMEAISARNVEPTAFTWVLFFLLCAGPPLTPIPFPLQQAHGLVPPCGIRTFFPAPPARPEYPAPARPPSASTADSRFPTAAAAAPR